MTDVLDIQTDGRLRVLRLNRPQRKNALNGELLGALAGALREAAHDDDVWAVALTGNGDAFCSGLDLDQDDDEAGGDEPSDDNSDEREPATDHLSLLMRVECE